MRCCQSTPNVRAISWTGEPPSLAAASRIRSFIITFFVCKRPAASDSLPHQEERVEHDCFGEGNGQNGLDQYFRGGAWIASDSFRGLHADESHADRCSERCQTDMQIPGHFCQHWC